MLKKQRVLKLRKVAEEKQKEEKKSIKTPRELIIHTHPMSTPLLKRAQLFNTLETLNKAANTFQLLEVHSQ